MSTKTTLGFKKTTIQEKAIRLLASQARTIMLYGGSRSGKSLIIIYAMIVRACKEKSRHIVLRKHFAHVKASIWNDTLKKVLSLCFPDLTYEENNTELYITLPNGSEIHCGGLDDHKRAEKILGREFSTIFFNECSQFDYREISIALTRLAEKNGLKKRVFMDQNPASKGHWSYYHFVLHRHHESGEPMDETNYVSMVMNPTDNIENIDQDYIDSVLGDLPEKERARFLRGEFTDINEGSIYYAFKRHDHTEKLTKAKAPLWAGMDFNVSPMTCVIGQIYDDTLHIIDEFFLKNSNTDEMCLKIKEKYGNKVTIAPDSTGKKQTTNASKSDIQILRSHGFAIKVANNPFRVDRYAAVNASIGKGMVKIDEKCRYLIKDLEQVRYKEGTDKPDTTDLTLTHISDALGYLIYRTINPLAPKYDGPAIIRR